MCQHKIYKQVKTFHVKCHFASKTQLISETNLYCCEDLKVTKNCSKISYVPKAMLDNEIYCCTWHILHIRLQHQHAMAVFLK